MLFLHLILKNQCPTFLYHWKKLNGAVDGDRVVVKLVKWNKDDKKPDGEVVTVIKAEDMNDFAMKELLIDGGFPLTFDEEVLKEAHGLSENITPDGTGEKKRLQGYFNLSPSTQMMRRILMMLSLLEI